MVGGSVLFNGKAVFFCAITFVFVPVVVRMNAREIF